MKRFLDVEVLYLLSCKSALLKQILQLFAFFVIGGSVTLYLDAIPTPVRKYLNRLPSKILWGIESRIIYAFYCFFLPPIEEDLLL